MVLAKCNFWKEKEYSILKFNRLVIFLVHLMVNLDISTWWAPKKYSVSKVYSSQNYVTTFKFHYSKHTVRTVAKNLSIFVVSNGEIFRVRGKEINTTSIKLGEPRTSLLFFQDSFARNCYVMVKRQCRVVCLTNEGQERMHSFSCQNVTQVC